MTWLWQCPWSIMNMFLWVIFSPQFWVIFHVVNERLCCFGMFLGKIKGKWVLKSDTVWRGHVSWHHLRTANLRTHTKKKQMQDDKLLSTKSCVIGRFLDGLIFCVWIYFASTSRSWEYRWYQPKWCYRIKRWGLRAWLAYFMCTDRIPIALKIDTV